MRAETLLMAARLNGALCALLIVLFFVLRTHRLFPNEYSISDGQMFFFYGLLIVLPVSILLVATALFRSRQAPQDRTLRSAALVSALPLLIPAAWALIALIP